MFLVLFVLLNVVHSLDCSKHRKRFRRIAHGITLETDSHPYLVGIQTYLTSGIPVFCTGTLIEPLHVLTAAHCIHSLRNIEVWRNKRHEDIRLVVKVFIHPRYRQNDVIADVCILQLNAPFLGVNRYAKLSKVQPNAFENGNSLNCSILGWGQTENENFNVDKPRIANVSVTYGQTACPLPLNDSENHNMKKVLEKTWDQFLCAKPNEILICPGDSGGPLICDGHQLGIASHIYSTYRSADDPYCGHTNVQSRHTYVYNYSSWITRTCQSSDASIKESFVLSCTTKCLLMILFYKHFL